MPTVGRLEDVRKPPIAPPTTKKLTVDEVLPKDAVQAVPASAGERIANLLFANDKSLVGIAIIAVSLVASLLLAVSSERLATQAFTLLNSMASGAVGYFFASRSRSD